MQRAKINVGVVGLGVGSGHVRNYQSLPDVNLIALCDSDAPWLRHCQEQWGVPRVFTDYREMFALETLDAVSIALPTLLHKTATVTALEAGKHVLVEKPMAIDAREAEAMTAAARRAGRTLMISHNQRFTADALNLKRCIDQGHLGVPYFARTLWRRPMGMLPPPVMERATGAYDRNWFNEADKGGGVARDLGSHVLDLALWLLGFPEVADVSGCAYTIFGPQSETHRLVKFDADDHSVGFVRFKNGASLQIEASFGQHIDQETVVTEIFGSKGGARRESGQPLRLFGAAEGACTTNEPAGSTQAEFVESLLQDRPPLVTPEQGITIMRIIDALRENKVPLNRLCAKEQASSNATVR